MNNYFQKIVSRSELVQLPAETNMLHPLTDTHTSFKSDSDFTEEATSSPGSFYAPQAPQQTSTISNGERPPQKETGQAKQPARLQPVAIVQPDISPNKKTPFEADPKATEANKENDLTTDQENGRLSFNTMLLPAPPFSVVRKIAHRVDGVVANNRTKQGKPDMNDGITRTVFNRSISKDAKPPAIVKKTNEREPLSRRANLLSSQKNLQKATLPLKSAASGKVVIGRITVEVINTRPAVRTVEPAPVAGVVQGSARSMLTVIDKKSFGLGQL